jgi:hypothetical protein
VLSVIFYVRGLLTENEIFVGSQDETIDNARRKNKLTNSLMKGKYLMAKEGLLTTRCTLADTLVK